METKSPVELDNTEDIAPYMRKTNLTSATQN